MISCVLWRADESLRRLLSKKFNDAVIAIRSSSGPVI